MWLSLWVVRRESIPGRILAEPGQSISWVSICWLRKGDGSMILFLLMDRSYLLSWSSFIFKLVDINKIRDGFAQSQSQYGLPLRHFRQLTLRNQQHSLQNVEQHHDSLPNSTSKIYLPLSYQLAHITKTEPITIHPIRPQLSIGYLVFRKVVVRIGFVGAGSTTVYYCLKYLPVSTVNTVLNLAPVFIFFI